MASRRDIIDQRGTKRSKNGLKSLKWLRDSNVKVSPSILLRQLLRQKAKSSRKLSHSEETEEKGFRPSIIWSALQSDQLLQHLASTGFCVQTVLEGTGTPAVPKPITIFVYQKIITASYWYVSRNQPE